MTLSCVFYNVNDADFDKLMGVFRSVFNNEKGNFRVDARFVEAEQAARLFTQTNGIRLLVTYVSAIRNEEGKAIPDMEAIRLGHVAAHTNRDNYILYLAQDNETLLRMSSACIRAVATMTLPMFIKRGQTALSMIQDDYQRLTANESMESGEWVSLKTSGGKVIRVHTSQLYAIMSDNKQLEVRTADGTMKVHGSLDSLQTQLGSGFCRCHRSTLINLSAIQYVDFPNMTIALVDGSMVPLAKSFRQAMSQIVNPNEQRKAQ